MPCWTRSPRTTNRIRSNGCNELSSRRPAILVTRKMKKKTTVARMTRSMASGEDRQRAVDASYLCRAVIQHDILASFCNVGWIDLEIDPHDQRVPGRQLVVGQNDTSVACCLIAGIRRDRVDTHRLPPSGTEHELGL